MRSPVLTLLAVLVLALGAYGVYRLTRPAPDDTTQIRNLVLTAARALEQSRVQRFMALIAEDYYDGTYRKADLVPLVRGAVLQHGELRVIPYVRALQIHGETATAMVEAEVTLGEIRSDRPQAELARGRYTVEVALRKGRRGWQVTSAHGWEPAQSQFGGEW